MSSGILEKLNKSNNQNINIPIKTLTISRNLFGQVDYMRIIRTRIIAQVSAMLIIGLFIFINIISCVTMGMENDDPAPNINTRAEPLNDVRVFFHRDNILNTIPGNDTLPQAVDSLTDGQNIDFALEPELMGDLYVKGLDLGSGKFGFEIDLRISILIPGTDGDITFQIKDGTKIVATNPNPIFIEGGAIAEDEHDIPFKDDGITEYTFKSGNSIHVNINVSITSGSSPVFIYYEQGFNDGYLELSCNHISSKKVIAKHADDTIGEFYPNMPHSNQRGIKLTGSVTDKFGAYDIDHVELSVDKLFDRLAANYTYNLDDEIGYFEMAFTYPLGLSAGDYLITAYITDNSRSDHIENAQFTMAKYGTYLECLNNTDEGFPGEIVNFKIDVYNVGGNSDSIKLEATANPATWDTNFVGGSTTGLLTPGEITTKTLEVTVASSADKNDKCTVEVRGDSVNDGKSINDKNWPLEPPISVLAKPQFNFDFDLNSESIQYVEAGQSAVYEFTLENTGSDQDTYTVSGEEQPLENSDWELLFTCDNPNAVKVSDLKYTIVLSETKAAKFTLTVTAPSDPPGTVPDLDLTLLAISTNITDTSRKTIAQHTQTIFDDGGGGHGEVTLGSSIKTRTADPGPTIDFLAEMQVMFNIDATNEDSTNTFNVDIEVDVNPKVSWNMDLSPSDFTLDPEDTELISLIIDIQEFENAGDYQITVTAAYGQGQEANLELTVVIPKVYDVFLAAEVSEMETESGKSVEYDFSLLHLGNVKDMELELTFNEPSGWEVEVSKKVVTMTEYGDIVNLTITVKPLASGRDDDRGIIDIEVRSKDTGKTIGNKLTFKTSVKKDTGQEVVNFLYDYWFVFVMVIFIIVITFVIRAKLK